MSRSDEQLSGEERGVIMAMELHGRSSRSIALILSRSPSTIGRELTRNGYKSTAEATGRPRVAGGYNAGPQGSARGVNDAGHGRSGSCVATV